MRVTLNPFDPLGSLAIILGPELLRKVLIVGKDASIMRVIFSLVINPRMLSATTSFVALILPCAWMNVKVLGYSLMRRSKWN
jgi:hypothetical protein